MTQQLLCVLCPFDARKRGEVEEPARYVLRGYSVCNQHVGYVMASDDWHVILAALRKAK